ncbi:putative malate:quinone oxidoreductase [Mammaliicoccus stepanovicii]|uniref:Probable malate:quinone oxidoreductase n=2 Tax=Mammaliicoccus stepanovicii TaxID=643214 RepID=A0A239ZD00_9STAP|nr:putative malate:quinone oxidoreductase [Mammaliicoccus stepanovicii]SNV68574.1 malate:quinone oxidoreductase [Mammaliicoccus stepanovicii]
MSATLGVMLKELSPNLEIKLFEKLSKPAEESSNEWNNAGTGHSALCEMNYTKEESDGSVNIDKAIQINEQFQLSKQFWTYLVNQGQLTNPEDFIRPVPHMSFVYGDHNIEFLKKRCDALSKNPLFNGMTFTDDFETLKHWMPLMMEGRPSHDKIAATKIESGTDVNFGNLTRSLFDDLQDKGVELNFNHSVQNLRRNQDNTWQLKIYNSETKTTEYHNANFVFIGAGGGSLPLLQKTGIKQASNIGGFPVSGLFMVCNNDEVIAKHDAKVYGKAKVGAPPMSVPHLDTRYIEGKRSLLFGPFAGFSPKFLKTGSNIDLLGSVKPNNVLTMLSAGLKEMGLTKYLVEQVLLSDEKRLEELKEFIPNAKLEDWEIVVAGQRVQVIKDTKEGGKGTLQFGTELVTSDDGSISALLGASPGASTAVHVMLQLLEKCFPQDFPQWEDKIKQMIPSFRLQLSDHPDLFDEINSSTSKALGLYK